MTHISHLFKLSGGSKLCWLGCLLFYGNLYPLGVLLGMQHPKRKQFYVIFAFESFQSSEWNYTGMQKKKLWFRNYKKTVDKTQLVKEAATVSTMLYLKHVVCPVGGVAFNPSLFEPHLPISQYHAYFEWIMNSIFPIIQLFYFWGWNLQWFWWFECY